MQELSPDSLLHQVVRTTNLLTRNTADLTAIVYTKGEHRKRSLPVLPDVFVLTGDDDSDNSDNSDDRANDEYCKRFTAHLALELRCQVLAQYEDFIDRCLGGGWKREAAIQKAIKQRGKNSARGPPGPVDVWQQQAPLHPHVACLAIAVKVAQTNKPGLMIEAVTGKDLTSLRKQLRADEWRTNLFEPAVKLAAQHGVVPVLYPDAIVAVLIPLASYATAYLGVHRHGDTVRQSAGALVSEARRVLDSLPEEWVAMGCIPLLGRVCDVNFACNAVSIKLFPMHAASDEQTRVIDKLCSNDQWRSRPFFVAELTTLRGPLMELEALQSIDRTRFAATLYDPWRTAPQSAAFYDWATSLLTAAGPLRATPLLPMLRARLLFQQQLNDWQIRAIAAVLYAACPRWDGGVAEQSTQAAMPRAPEVLVIEGPPGTGKTQTIGSLTLNLVHHLSRVRGTAPRVLVCAPSNCAVDEALLRVLRLRTQLSEAAAAGGDDAEVAQRPVPAVLSGGLLRIGVREKVDAEVLKLNPPVFLDSVVEAELPRGPPSQATGPYFYKQRKELEEKLVGAAAIIFTTLGSLPRVEKLTRGERFAVVIVDEASQCTEPAVLQALRLTASKCVLVGDTNQLQPTVISKEASRCGLCRSLLVRLLSCGHRSFMLRTQYRMHRDIVAFPNAYFYDRQLLTDESVHLRSRVPVGTAAAQRTIAQRLGQRPRFVFVDVADSRMERRGGRSLQNAREAAAVVECMRQLRSFLGMSLPEMAEHTGIITPYTAQKELLESMLSQPERASGLQVSTVDSFQGKEKSIILLSLVRTVRPAPQRRRCQPADSDDASDRTTAEELEANAHAYDSFRLGFLADWRRLNVALTRAQDLCMCFASARTIEVAGAAATAVGGGDKWHHHRVTTLSDVAQDVIDALRADAEDPLTLSTMLAHARARTGRDVAAAPAAAVVTYRQGMSLMASLTPHVAGATPTHVAPSSQ